MDKLIEQFKIIIIGSGPSGISAAVHAAELGVPHILLESEPAPANTVRKFQLGKYVMAEPKHIPLRSAVSFAAGTREKVLKTWEDELVSKGVNLRLNSQVVAISGELGNFVIETAGGDRLGGDSVILAIGLQGNIRKLGVPGEELPMVQYQLDDPDAFVDETIIVVGGGDAGVENALALMAKNRVILLNQDKEFNYCNEEICALLKKAEDDFMIETLVGSKIEQATAIKESGFSLMLTVKTPNGTEKIACHRVIARLGADPPRELVESFGVTFPSAERSSLPQLSSTYESNMPGFYIIGALAGFPLIKKALNQGYEVVEHILGNFIEPADEVLLGEKLSDLLPDMTTGEKLAHIRQRVPLLASLTPLQLREFLLESTVLQPGQDDFIFKHNDYSTSFFAIVHGEVTLFPENKRSSFVLKTGDFFGETGLLSGRSTSSAAKAGNHCLLIETPRRSMLSLIERVSSVREILREKTLERAVQNYFDLPLPRDDLDYLVGCAHHLHFDAGDFLFKEKDKSDGLYLIKQGSVTISRGSTVLAFLTAGRYVGEMELISGDPHTTQAQAATATAIAFIGSMPIAEVLSRNAALRKHLDERYLQQVHENELETLYSNSADEISGPLNLSFLLKQGISDATDVLLIDYSLCIRCDICEKACSETHGGVSRLKREAGITYANIHVPTACRHCEDPLCMKDCPPDAIHRSINGEVFIDDTCISCGNCVKNCPYDAVELASINPENHRPSLMGFMIDLVVGHEMTLPDEYHAAPKKAVKCDLCSNFMDGPACVRACPTGAAFRVKAGTVVN